MAQAMDPGPLSEEVKQSLGLHSPKPRFTAGMTFGGEARLPLVCQGIPPATDRPGRRLHLANDLANTPAHGQQGRRPPTTHGQLLFSAHGAHAPLIGPTDSLFSEDKSQ